jgi:hypothetical protein
MTTISKTARIAALCIAAPLCFLSPAHAAQGEGWVWMVAPYGWAASIGADLETAVPPSPAIADKTFDDILDKFDGAFQVHIEGQGDRFGVFADFTYLGLADEKNFSRFATESDLDTRLFEVAAVWSPGAEHFRGFDVFAGLRYIDVDFTLKLDPVNPAFGNVTVDSGDSFSDFMLGARYTWAMSERWGLTLRGDGSFGETEGTWNASAIGQYRMKRGAWFLGYRYLAAEFDNGSAEANITLSGPLVGYGFMF